MVSVKSTVPVSPVSQRISVSVSTSIISTVSVSTIVSISLRLGLSRSLASEGKSLNRPGNIRGTSGVACDTSESIAVVRTETIRTDTIAVETIVSIGISRPLSPQAKNSAGETGSRYTRPVGVGVVEGRVAIAIAIGSIVGIGISLGCSQGHSGQRTSNQDLVHCWLILPTGVQ